MAWFGAPVQLSHDVAIAINMLCGTGGPLADVQSMLGTVPMWGVWVGSIVSTLVLSGLLASVWVVRGSVRYMAAILTSAAVLGSVMVAGRVVLRAMAPESCASIVVACADTSAALGASIPTVVTQLGAAWQPLDHGFVAWFFHGLVQVFPTGSQYAAGGFLLLFLSVTAAKSGTFLSVLGASAVGSLTYVVSQLNAVPNLAQLQAIGSWDLWTTVHGWAFIGQVLTASDRLLVFSTYGAARQALQAIMVPTRAAEMVMLSLVVTAAVVLLRIHFVVWTLHRQGLVSLIALKVAMLGPVWLMHEQQAHSPIAVWTFLVLLERWIVWVTKQTAVRPTITLPSEEAEAEQPVDETAAEDEVPPSPVRAPTPTPVSPASPAAATLTPAPARSASLLASFFALVVHAPIVAAIALEYLSRAHESVRLIPAMEAFLQIPDLLRWVRGFAGLSLALSPPSVPSIIVIAMRGMMAAYAALLLRTWAGATTSLCTAVLFCMSVGDWMHTCIQCVALAGVLSLHAVDLFLTDHQLVEVLQLASFVTPLLILPPDVSNGRGKPSKLHWLNVVTRLALCGAGAFVAVRQLAVRVPMQPSVAQGVHFGLPVVVMALWLLRSRSSSHQLRVQPPPVPPRRTKHEPAAFRAPPSSPVYAAAPAAARAAPAAPPATPAVEPLAAAAARAAASSARVATAPPAAEQPQVGEFFAQPPAQPFARPSQLFVSPEPAAVAVSPASPEFLDFGLPKQRPARSGEPMLRTYDDSILPSTASRASAAAPVPPPRVTPGSASRLPAPASYRASGHSLHVPSAASLPLVSPMVPPASANWSDAAFGISSSPVNSVEPAALGMPFAGISQADIDEDIRARQSLQQKRSQPPEIFLDDDIMPSSGSKRSKFGLSSTTPTRPWER